MDPIFPCINLSNVVGMGMSERPPMEASSETLFDWVRALLSFSTSGSSILLRTNTSAVRDLGSVSYMLPSLDRRLLRKCERDSTIT